MQPDLGSSEDLCGEQDEDGEFEAEESDITSLSSSVLEYEYENGRRYHSSRTGHYMYVCASFPLLKCGVIR